MRLQATPQQTAAANAARVFWPDAVTYREAIQNPAAVLADPQLAVASVAVGRQGLPIAYTGRFAVVFRLRAPDGDWAARCFTTRSQDRCERYAAIAACLERRLPPGLVPFRYIEDGIRIGSGLFPLLAMRWAEGETLGRFVEINRDNPIALLDLCDALSALRAALEAAGVAHGDWQHDNLLVSESGRKVTLVDYDGMFVPELAGHSSVETGHPNYQHPARTAAHFAVGLDGFAHLVIQTALLALCGDPSLWTRFSDGESLLFKKSDLDNPAASPVFRALRESAARDTLLRECLARLEAACAAGTDGVFLPAPPPAPAAKRLRTLATAQAGPPAARESRSGFFFRRRRRRAEKAKPAAPRYLDRLNSVEMRTQERRHLWTVLGCLVLTVLFSLAITLLMAVAGVLIGAVLYSLLLSCGHYMWPRARLHRALLRDLKQARAAVRRCARWDSRPDYVTYELAKVPIGQAFFLGNIRHDTIYKMKAAGFETAADLQNLWRVGGVSEVEWRSLNSWAGRLTRQAVRRFEAQASLHQGPEAEAARREQEKTEHQKRAAELAREQALFPDASRSAYHKVLFTIR